MSSSSVVGATFLFRLQLSKQSLSNSKIFREIFARRIRKSLSQNKIAWNGKVSYPSPTTTHLIACIDGMKRECQAGSGNSSPDTQSHKILSLKIHVPIGGGNLSRCWRHGFTNCRSQTECPIQNNANTLLPNIKRKAPCSLVSIYDRRSSTLCLSESQHHLIYEFGLNK
jgi:hypothetical protein